MLKIIISTPAESGILFNRIKPFARYYVHWEQSIDINKDYPYTTVNNSEWQLNSIENLCHISNSNEVE